MTRFFQLSGGGNDFLALAEPESKPTSTQIATWCRRGLSVGADGLFLLERADSGVTMTHFNADGSAAELCLNGTRCAVQLAHHLGWCHDDVEIVTGAGRIRGHRIDHARTALVLPVPEPPRPKALKLESDTYQGWTITVGVPHFVLLWYRSLQTAPVEEVGRLLRSHPDLGSEGANVDFVRFPSVDRIEIRTFERGVEAETLACGTGVLAAAAVGLDTADLSLPAEAKTQGGFELAVAPAADGGRLEWLFSGDARILCQGEMLDGAADTPAPVEWSS